MYKYLGAILCLCFYFTGCALESNTEAYTTCNKHITTDTLTNRKLLIIPPVIDSILILNKDEVRKAFSNFSGSPREIIRSAFIQFLTADSNKSFITKNKELISLDTGYTPRYIDTTNFIFVKDTAREFFINNMYYVPKSKVLTDHHYDPNIIAQITSMQIERYVDTVSTFLPTWASTTVTTTPEGNVLHGNHYTGYQRREQVIARINFIIYDTRWSDYIQFGNRIVIQWTNEKYLSKKKWAELFNQIIGEMLKGTTWNPIPLPTIYMPTMNMPPMRVPSFPGH